MQFLIQWANGTFQVMTGEQLKKEVEEWDNVPPRVYRLVPNRDPEYLYSVKVSKCWLLTDIFHNWIEL